MMDNKFQATLIQNVIATTVDDANPKTEFYQEFIFAQILLIFTHFAISFAYNSSSK